MCLTRTLVYGGVGGSAAAAGAVLVARLPLDAGEALCGMGGCFPPLPPLLAMHLLWAVSVGAVAWGAWVVRPSLLRPVGTLAVLTAVLAAAAVVGRDVLDWLQWVPAEDRHLWPQKIAHAVATHTDLPFVQVAATGAVARLIGRVGGSCPGSCPRHTLPGGE
jgi:hypothetical protein